MNLYLHQAPLPFLLILTPYFNTTALFFKLYLSNYPHKKVPILLFLFKVSNSCSKEYPTCRHGLRENLSFLSAGINYLVFASCFL